MLRLVWLIFRELMRYSSLLLREASRGWGRGERHCVAWQKVFIRKWHTPDTCSCCYFLEDAWTIRTIGLFAHCY